MTAWMEFFLSGRQPQLRRRRHRRVRGRVTALFADRRPRHELAPIPNTSNRCFGGCAGTPTKRLLTYPNSGENYDAAAKGLAGSPAGLGQSPIRPAPGTTPGHASWAAAAARTPQDIRAIYATYGAPLSGARNP